MLSLHHLPERNLNWFHRCILVYFNVVIASLISYPFLQRYWLPRILVIFFFFLYCLLLSLLFSSSICFYLLPILAKETFHPMGVTWNCLVIFVMIKRVSTKENMIILFESSMLFHSNIRDVISENSALTLQCLVAFYENRKTISVPCGFDNYSYSFR